MKFNMTHFVKSQDLNHHETLFAGRMAEWFVEAGFVAAAGTYGRTDDLLCMKLHGLKMSAPVRSGEIITMTSEVIKVGTTSMLVYETVAKQSGEVFAEGFLTFVCVDENKRKKPHNITLTEAETEAGKKILAAAENVF